MEVPMQMEIFERPESPSEILAKAMKAAIPRFSGEKVMRDPKNNPLDAEIEPEPVDEPRS